MDEWYQVKPELPGKDLMIRTASIFIVLTAIVVALRIISRHVFHIKFGLEDLFVIIAVVLFWAQCSVHIAGILSPLAVERLTIDYHIAAMLTPYIPNIMHPNYVTYNKVRLNLYFSFFWPEAGGIVIANEDCIE